jgi:5-methylcytosine-specific restriction endonuclease McrA
MRVYNKINKEQLNKKARERNARDNRKKLQTQKRYRESHKAFLTISALARRAGCKAGKFAQADWEALKAFYDYRCVCCGRRETDISLEPDHVVSLKREGWHSKDNIQSLCRHCNAVKGANCVDYRWGWHERFGPFKIRSPSASTCKRKS